ncbi:MAG: D-alanyl-D-alanine carboxypeptidase [Geminicoccaceae bacterium]|jgi:D-alanyl-D-alanine carboxypeptidase|nr:D-alanyl-D-alanine carboxypeptidase [Geminicoccaceae bacterium]HRY26618.1 D-alanyl-D-alanine carboxypeptidase family protein [Geminicoccaceae bacterium]
MLCRLALAVFLLALGAATASPVQANSKYAAVVLDYATGEVLHSRRADVALYPASLTKMMTLYMLFEALERGELRLGSKLDVSRRAAGMPASKLGLGAGSTITVEQAIEAIVVKSANDVAVVIAEALAGSEPRFADAMTRRARAIGMRHTTFKNASGLPDRQQKSSAADMARLAYRLISDHPRYYPYFSRRSFSFNGVNHRGHNRLLVSYAGMDGLKTGYTRASGFNLAATARRSGERVIVVVFGGRSARTRDKEVARLLDLGFERVRERRPAPAIALLPQAKPGTTMAAVAVVDTADDAIAPEAGPVPALRPGTLVEVPGVRPAPVVAVAPAVSVLDALPPAERAVIVAAAANAPLPAPNPQRLVVSGGAGTAATGPFAVQVGAFHDSNLARRAAQTAARLVPQILMQGAIDVSPLKGRRRTVYRARVAGFERAVADEACQMLQQHHQECFVVQTRGYEVAGRTS